MPVASNALLLGETAAKGWLKDDQMLVPHNKNNMSNIRMPSSES